MTAAFSLLLFAAAAFGQGTTGQMSGTVTDPNGALVAGAAVKITNIATNYTRETTTSGDGIYGFQQLPPGRYRVEITATGFAATTAEADVNITQTTPVDVQLSVSGGTTTVNVEAPVLQTETSQQGRVVTGETLRQIPLPTRNFQQLLTLSAGAQSSVSNNTELGRGDATISVNGQRSTSNSVRINGIDANSIGTNSTPNIAVPATDTLQEFIVQTSLYDASNGRNAGGNVEAITRSGTNDLHGNVYYFKRDDSLNANDPFVKAFGLERPVLKRDQFGGTLGGPVIKNRVFFFGSYQGTREKNGASLTNSLTFPVVPFGLTDSNRTATGLASAFGLAPATINPVAVNLLNARLPSGAFAIPSSGATTRPAGCTAVNISLCGAQVVQSGESRFRENQFNINGDFNLSDKHTIAAKFFIADNPTFQANYNFAGLGNGPAQLVGFGGDLAIKQKLYSIADSYVSSSNVVNQFRVGFSRIRVTSVPEEPFTAASLGISNPLSSVYPGAPTLSFAGTDSGFFFGSSTLADQSSRINAYTASDTLSWTVGNHRLKFGGEYRFSQVKFYFNAFSRGQIIYGNTTQTAFQNFLQGIGTSLIGSGVFDRYYKVTDTNGFIQDDWKITPRLTVNLGLRYDLYGLPVEDQGRLVNFIPGQVRTGNPPNGFVQAEGGPLVGVPTVEKTLVPVDKNNFSPRVGFAFDLWGDQKVVVRGGYGVYYDRISTRYANTQLFNYPYFALGIGLVNTPLSTVLPATFRNASNPFIPVPLPSAFPTVATVPSPLSTLSPAGFPIAGVFIDPELQTPYVQQYNLGAQLQLGHNFVGEIGYVGNRGTHLLQVITINQPVYNPATNTFSSRLGGAFSSNKNLTGGMQQVQTTSVSRYNSLQMSLTKRFSDGLQFLAAYTVGNSYDYYSGASINELTNIPGDQYNWRLNGGPSDFNRKHRLVFSGVYDIPKLVDNASGAKWLLNGWQVAGVAVFQSGLPFSVIDSNGTSRISRANFNPNFAGSDFLTSGSVSDRLNQYFNTSAFASSCQNIASVSLPQVCGTATTPVNSAFDPNSPYGNAPRNLLFGPGQKNVDVSIIKFLPFTERFRGELRAEFFNVFNWVNYANPGSTLGLANFGKITSTSAGPRVVQFAFKLNF
ncbi:MAG: TonB-dependent receptor [Acidobacteriota bacterium]